MLDDPILKIAIAAASAGGAVTRKYFADLSSAQISNKSVAEKDEGLVTKADIESERAIIALIRDTFPDHQFLAEEEHGAGAKDDPNDAEHLWIIDPLDGTNNFANGMPHYAVSVACYKFGKPHCGVVLAPETNDQYVALAGQGAWHNDRRVGVNSQPELTEAMIGVGFYYDRGAMMKATLGAIEELFGMNIIGIRRMGTASLDLVFVGLGRFGGYFEFTLSPWDFAAGRLFVEEAGGKITTCNGMNLPIDKSSVLATNGLLHESLQNIVKKFQA